MKIHVLPKNVIVIQHTSQKSLLSLHFKISLLTERGKKRNQDRKQTKEESPDPQSDTQKKNSYDLTVNTKFIHN